MIESIDAENAEQHNSILFTSLFGLKLWNRWTKLQLTKLGSVFWQYHFEDPGLSVSNPSALGLVIGDVEEVGGDGDQEDQHPHNHLQIV